MFIVSSRILPQVAFVLSTGLLPSVSARAQEALVATARMSSRPLSGAGVDAGKFFVSLKISGIPEIGLRSLTRDQMVLVDAFGHTYTPIGYVTGASGKETKTPLAAYTTPSGERIADREYLFLVAPGLNAFEVRVGNLKPVRVVALPRGPLR